MPVIALTGATGFVGRALVTHLLATRPESEIRLLVRGAAQRPLPAAWRSDRVRVIPGSLNDRDALNALVEGSDTVVHIAAAIAGNRLEDFERSNIVGTRSLLESLSLQAPSSHLIQISSLAARRPELSWYSATKRAAEELVCVRWPVHSIIRPPAVYGPDDPALASFWKLLARGWLLRLGSAQARFSLLHVDDLVRLIDTRIEAGANAAIIEAAGPQPDGGWSWSAVAAVAAGVRGAPVRTLALPGALLRSAGWLGPLTGRLTGTAALLNPGKVRELQHIDWVCDNLHDATGWRSMIALDQALTDLPGWRTA